ncbi:MAG: hypothetical protein WCG04_06545 [Alphaproteobacteria bacterium]
MIPNRQNSYFIMFMVALMSWALCVSNVEASQKRKAPDEISDPGHDAKRVQNNPAGEDEDKKEREAEKKGMTQEQAINLLNRPEHQEFLKSIVIEIYNKDKLQPYLQQKMCAHNDVGDIATDWKAYKKPATVKSKQWGSMVKRASLFLFTVKNSREILEKNLANIDSIKVSAGGGNDTSVVILAIYNTGEKVIGVKHQAIGVEKWRVKGTLYPYSVNALTKIEVMVDISALVKQITASGHIPEKIGDTTDKVKTICPSN